MIQYENKYKKISIISQESAYTTHCMLALCVLIWTTKYLVVHGPNILNELKLYATTVNFNLLIVRLEKETCISLLWIDETH